MTKAGVALIAGTDVADASTADLAFRLEAWNVKSDHIGAGAARHEEWVDWVYRILRDN